MKPNYLLDPWLVDVKTDDLPEDVLKRGNALNKTQNIHRKYGMERVRFLSSDRLHAFYTTYSNSRRPDVRELFLIIKSILLPTGGQTPPVELLDTPCPDFTEYEHWLCTLGEHGIDNTAPNWRRPFVLIPESRPSNWPGTPENNFMLRYKINGDAAIFERSLVCIEKYEQHTFFETAIDPWRLRSSGASDIIKMLPRPFPLSDTFTQIFNALQGRVEWFSEQTEKAYFIPEAGWDPRTFTLEGWRDKGIFKKETLQESRSKHNGRSGYVDREGRIWIWHAEESHWDVQFPKGSKWKYWSVSNSGAISKKRS